MILRLMALLVAIVPCAATAGFRAVYVPRLGESQEVKVADNGDIDAQLDGSRRLIVRDGHSYVVTDRLTGQLVDRVDDLAALVGDRWAAISDRTAAPPSRLVRIGKTEVHGRSGTAYGWAKAAGTQGSQEPDLVVSDDPALRPLAGAMRQVWDVESLLYLLDYPQTSADFGADHAATLRLLEQGAPLKYGDTELETLESEEIRLPPFELADRAEPLDVLRQRREHESRDDDAKADNTNVSRAVFAESRLWLITDDGMLASVAEGETELRRETVGEPILDICSGPRGVMALSGQAAKGRQWKLWRRENGSWQAGRTIPRTDDAPLALMCGGNFPILLTNGRLIEIKATGERVTQLSPELAVPFVAAVVHETAEHLFVGLNAGEWGGGLVRIERKTGRWIRIERSPKEDSCGGPLSTSCDPVHGVATVPWKPSCVAAAIGLIHFMAHGRIVEICGTSVRQIFAQASDRNRTDPDTNAEAAKGGYGAVAFFGLAAARDSLVAVGHDGLYRLDAAGNASHQPWPRFTKIDGLLVSFALPDLVLVVTTINRRASVSGGAPMLVVR